MIKLEYKNQIAFHPGYYIKEMLEYEGMSQTKLAGRLQISEKISVFLCQPVYFNSFIQKIFIV